MWSTAFFVPVNRGLFVGRIVRTRNPILFGEFKMPYSIARYRLIIVKFLTASLLLPFFLTGCTLTNGNNPAASAFGKIAFTYAVNVSIDKHGADAQGIVDQIDSAMLFLEGDSTATVAEVAMLINSEIDYTGMEVNKAIAIRSTVDLLAGLAEQSLRDRGVVPEDTYVAISEVLKWIRDTALIRVMSDPVTA